MARSRFGAKTLLSFSVGVRHFLMTSARVSTVLSKDGVSETSVARTGRAKGSGLVALAFGLAVTAALSGRGGEDEVSFPRGQVGEVALVAGGE